MYKCCSKSKNAAAKIFILEVVPLTAKYLSIFHCHKKLTKFNQVSSQKLYHKKLYYKLSFKLKFIKVLVIKYKSSVFNLVLLF